MKHYTYLLLDLGTILFPLILSFDKKVFFYKYWKATFAGILATAILFITWDSLFTQLGIWSFNEEYIIGYSFLNLPIEEWLFFIVVPFACNFIYKCLLAYFTFEYKGKCIKLIYYFFATLLIILALIYMDKIYTFSCCLVGGVFLFLLAWRKSINELFWYFITYVIQLIPFGICNGILTSLPILLYNDNENSSFRIGTIPIEDFVYSMILVFMNMMWMDYFQKKISKQTIESTLK